MQAGLSEQVLGTVGENIQAVCGRARDADAQTQDVRHDADGTEAQEYVPEDQSPETPTTQELEKAQENLHHMNSDFNDDDDDDKKDKQSKGNSEEQQKQDDDDNGEENQQNKGNEKEQLEEQNTNPQNDDSQGKKDPSANTNNDPSTNKDLHNDSDKGTSHNITYYVLQDC